MTGAPRLVVVRAQPGAARTLAAIAAAGAAGEAMPLFRTAPLSWTPPDPAGFDALVLTSAATIAHGGAGLAALAALPVIAVGAATAAAARAAGFAVAATGDGDAAMLADLAAARGWRRLLHPGGRDRMALAGAERIDVYAAQALAAPADAAARLHGTTVLIHSARGARAVARLPGVERDLVRLAAISAPALAAAGTGWRARAVAARPSDAALVAVAMLRD